MQKPTAAGGVAMRQLDESQRRVCPAHTLRLLVAAFVGILIVTLTGCGRPEPSQDAVLDEGYLAFPNATKIKEEFEQGSGTGWSPEGGGELPDPSDLFIVYDLAQPTPPEAVWDWYEEQLQAEGWAVRPPKWPSATTLRKEVGDTVHTITIRTLAPKTDGPQMRYQVAGEGETATRFTLEYVLYFR